MKKVFVVELVNDESVRTKVFLADSVKELLPVVDAICADETDEDEVPFGPWKKGEYGMLVREREPYFSWLFKVRISEQKLVDVAPGVQEARYVGAVE